MTERRPIEIIRELSHERESWSDDQILAELVSVFVLPDETDDLAWEDPQTQHRLHLYLALADQVAKRKLREGVLLLLAQASYGDFGETRRGLRHNLECAYDGDWLGLANDCIEASKYPQRGARLWAIDELGRLVAHEPGIYPGLSILLEALSDPAELVRSSACLWLESLCNRYPGYKDKVREPIQRLVINLSRALQKTRETLDNIENSE